MGRRPYARRLPLEQRREQLLDAALAVLLREGYAAMSIEAIAREAGVTRPVVYGAYDGLGALLGALLDRQQARALAQVADTLRPDSDLLDAITRLAEAVAADPDTWRPILHGPAGTPDVVRDRIDGDRQAVRRQLEAMLRSAGLPGEVDAELAGHALFAAMEELGRLLLAEPERVDVARVVGFARTVLAGLGLLRR